MQHQTETKRFILRPFQLSDKEDFFEMESDPEVHQFLGNTPLHSMDQIEAAIQKVFNQYAKNGIGRWAIEDKKTKEVVGWTGLKLEEEAFDFTYFDVGYRLKRKHWGKGIATETAFESVRYGFHQLNLDEIGGGAETEHGASNHILQKIGLEFVKTVKAFGQFHHWYNVDRDSWISKFEK